MISFRYHIVSIIAVFLALALGIVIGASGLRGAVLDDLHKQVRTLKSENISLRSDNEKLTNESGDANDYATQYASKVLANTLTGQSVVIVTTPGADKEGNIASAVSKAITAAGGKVTGRIGLTSAYLDPSSGPAITSLVTKDQPTGLTLPSTDDPAALAGAALGYTLSTKGAPDERRTLLAEFASKSLLTVPSSEVAAANLALVITSGSLNTKDAWAKSLITMTSQFTSQSLNAVVAGDTDSAQPNGLIAAVRGDDLAKVVSTVDNADTGIGQVTTALALSGLLTGVVDQYGTGPGAKDLFPSPAK
ncbi:MAG: copper transporter [Jatrophihabitans sp.]